MGRTLTLVLVLLAAALVARFEVRTPKPEPADAPATTFSAARAMVDDRAIAPVPHPVGSTANFLVRDYLVRRMTAMGLSPQIRAADAVNRREYQGREYLTGAHVENIVGVLPGRDRTTPALALMAHYDSVPGSPGAADDAAGVAAALEIVRAIKAEGVPARDVMVVITDGEEAGLLGANAFFRADPLAKRVGYVVNMETRGGGGRAQMFQTEVKNGQTVDLFARTAIRPEASSLAVFIYEKMPNDTDFTESLAAGVPGLNYAFIGRQFDYHSPTSTPDNLDQGTLQDLGQQALASSRALAFATALPQPAPAKVFANVFGSLTIAYPPLVGWLVVLAAAGLIAVGLRRARRTLVFSWIDVAQGAGAALYLVLAAVALLHFARRATGVGFGFMEQRPLLAQVTGFEIAVVLIGLGAVLYAAASVARGKMRIPTAILVLGAGLAASLVGGWSMMGAAVGVAGALVAVIVFGRATELPGAWAGVLITGLAAAVAAQAFAPATAFLFAWPLLLATIGAAATGLYAAPRPWALPLVAALAVVALAWLGGFAHGLYLGLDMPELLALPAWLAAMLIWPLAHPKIGGAGRILALAALVVGFALVLWIRMHDPWTARHPDATQIGYQLDVDKGQAFRFSAVPARNAWTTQALTADGGKIAKGRVEPLFVRQVDIAPARLIAAQPATLGLTRQPDGAVALHAVPPPDARIMMLELTANTAVSATAVNGVPVKLLSRPGKPTVLNWSGSPQGITVTLRPTGPGRLDVRYATVKETWPAEAIRLPRRPPTVSSFAWDGSTIVTGSRRFAW